MPRTGAHRPGPPLTGAAPQDRVTRFYATAIPGLEPVVADEITERLPGVTAVRVHQGRRQGRVSFVYERSPRHLQTLGSVRGVYAQLAEIDGVTVGQPGLARVTSMLAGLSFGAVGRLLRGLQPDIDPSTFQLSATVQGPHRFQAAELAQAAETALCEGAGLRRRPVSTAMHLALQVDGRRAHLGVRLPAADDGDPLAYCVARLAGIGPGDRVLLLRTPPVWADVVMPACGAEWCLNLVDTLPHLPASATVLMDGEHWPVGDEVAGSVIGFAGDPRLAEIRQWTRALVPGGTVVVVVADASRFATMLRQHEVPLEVMAAVAVNLNGRQRTIFVLGSEAPDDPAAVTGPPLLQIDPAS